MGSTYETLLVAADFDATVDALRHAGVTAVVVPLADERVAVVPKEGDWDTAPVRSIGANLSLRLGCPTLAMCVFDSDLVRCYVIRDGETVHTYISDAEMLVEAFEDEDGQFHPMIDNVVYPVDFKIPAGPIGDDPAAFAPFAAGPPDLDAVGAALRDEGVAPYMMAEVQHWAIIEALGLPPEALTTAYRHCDPADFPAAVVLD
ncbi:hypothetical protein ODJ79_26645 [Actinoplanes sp. KI2]|uniref:hypothetical protein n=1 Tax=Actinoplanes sp. KI2 TaxID=2983315 RepID=UPI0021D5B904|nr:hypothetical protein [Actinoplanes sp. KI2]MCU7727325.1 hypothetical protein [Actinoplanes sp. KI2]